MLLCTQVHGIGQVISDKDRHPDIGLGSTQSLGGFVLCPKRLIDSFLLVALLRSPECPVQDQDGMGCAEAQEWY